MQPAQQPTILRLASIAALLYARRVRHLHHLPELVAFQM
jgi:hypothetical protein